MAVNHGNNRRRAGPVLLVLAIVVLQLVAAWVLDHAADQRVGLVLAILVVGVAIGLNLVRFVLWGYAHRRWPLSHIYPLTALFFPCIVVLSWFQGDAIGIMQILGTALITAGALVMSSGRTAEEGDDD